MSKKVTVTTYSGYRGEEEPRAFSLDGDNIEVLAVQKRWMEQGKTGGVTKRFFTIKGSDGYVYTLSHDEVSGEWVLEAR